MRTFWTRPALAVLTAAGLFGAVFALASGSSGADAAREEHTIDIIATGFNPETCVINRGGDSVHWHNKDTKVHKITFPGNPILEDSPDLQPGDTWVGISHDGGQAEFHYQDAYDPSMKGVIVVPLDPNARASCSPLPPTPTPTPTRLPTATPTATPTAPTPPPIPPRCIGLVGCAVAPSVAKDAGD